MPKLTAEERAAVRRRLRELDQQDARLFLHEATDLMFQDTDKQAAQCEGETTTQNL